MLLPAGVIRSRLCRLFDLSPSSGAARFRFEVLAFSCVLGAISSLVFMLVQVDQMSAVRLQLASRRSTRLSQPGLTTLGETTYCGSVGPNLESLPLWACTLTRRLARLQLGFVPGGVSQALKTRSAASMSGALATVHSSSTDGRRGASKRWPPKGSHQADMIEAVLRIAMPLGGYTCCMRPWHLQGGL